MIQSKTQRMNYNFTPENHSPFPNNLPTFHFNKFITSLQNYPTPLPIHEFAPNASCISNSSTSDEAEEQQVTMINERKRRRMISNRESARRSRMRKQRQFDELWSQIQCLKNENHSLVEKINYVTESYDKVVLENARLKEEASNLRLTLSDLQITESYTILSDLEEVTWNKGHVKGEFPLLADTFFNDMSLLM